MNIKVGDIIRYNGRDVRVMKLNNFPKLAYFYQVYNRLTDDMLVESDDSPEFEIGDEVVIHPIPREERLCYGSGWRSEMTPLVGSTQTVTEVRYSPECGRRVKLGGFWFQVYHLERANQYDMI